MSNRRARGHYSPLICKRCRARKIKCNLPNSVTGPSVAPQPLNLACQRCKQNGFECFVESTVLGRPGPSRHEGIDRATLIADAPANDHNGSGLGTRAFLLSQPYDDEGVTGHRITPEEVCEAMSSPLRFLSVLLSRRPAFGMDLHGHGDWVGPVPLYRVISSAAEDKMEAGLVWHRLYYPYLPTLHSLRERLQSGSAGYSTNALYALLCLLAFEHASILSPLRALKKKQLRYALYHCGQATLIKPLAHRDTVTFFQLLAEYRPLALVNSPVAAVAALTDSSYLSLAVKTAKEIGLDQLWMYLDSEEPLLETLQWLHLFLNQAYSGFVIGKSDMRQDSLAAIQPIIEKLESLVQPRSIPSKAVTLTMNILLAVKSANARQEMALYWRSLDEMRAIVQRHHSHTDNIRKTAMSSSEPTRDEDNGQGLVITAILDAEIHEHRLLVKQSAMFFAVMAASYLRDEAQFDPSEIEHLGEHIINHLKVPLHISQVHAFMGEFGSTTADELEKQLTDFIDLCDLRSGDITYSPPTKTFASEVLHTAYLLVQQNAARLKGWGGLHDRVDSHIIVLRDSARKLVILAGQEEDEGKILVPVASLVRDLGGILSTWIRRLDRAPVSTSSIKQSGVESAVSASSSSLNTDAAPPQSSGSRATDIFATWEMWPQPEEIDFSEFIDFDYDPSTGSAA